MRYSITVKPDGIEYRYNIRPYGHTLAIHSRTGYTDAETAKIAAEAWCDARDRAEAPETYDYEPGRTVPTSARTDDRPGTWADYEANNAT